MTTETSAALGMTRTSWLGRYRVPAQIRKRRTLVLASTTRLKDGSPCVVLLAGPGASQSRTTEALAKIERAHNAIDDPHIPRVTAKGVFQGNSFLELDCDAVIDGLELHRHLLEGRRRVPVDAAVAFALALGRTLDAAHAARISPSTEPLCLGKLSTANLLFSPSGCFYLVGFGHNFALETPCGQPDGSLVTFQASEVAFGGPPSPGADHVALHLLLRSLLPLMDLSPTLARIFLGDLGPLEREILHCMRWPYVRMVAQPPALRATRAEEVAVTNRLCELCRILPDIDSFATFVREAAVAIRAPSSSVLGRRTLVIGVETSWMIGTDGSRYVLGQAHRRIVTALAELHSTSPCGVLTIPQILEIGWPGERPIPEAGTNRVYVALTQLRRMGMRDVLERVDGGYRLAPTVDVALSS